MSVEMAGMLERHAVLDAELMWSEAAEQLEELGPTRGMAMPGGMPPAPGAGWGATREIVSGADSLGPKRSDAPAFSDPFADPLARLRNRLKGELVGFHDHLLVTRYTGARSCAPGRTLWQIEIPLTLFPRRDQGFSRLECIVELHSPAGPESFRVIELAPAARAEVLARLDFGAMVDLDTRVQLHRLPAPLASQNALVSDVAARVYGKAHADFSRELRRECVVSEIIDGTGARWRLDDSSHPERVGPEGHQLAIVVEAAPHALPLHLTGLLQAYSDVRWLTSSLASVWQNFRGKVETFFRRGAPVEAFGEWSNILPATPWQ